MFCAGLASCYAHSIYAYQPPAAPVSLSTVLPHCGTHCIVVQEPLSGCVFKQSAGSKVAVCCSIASTPGAGLHELLTALVDRVGPKGPTEKESVAHSPLRPPLFGPASHCFVGSNAQPRDLQCRQVWPWQRICFENGNGSLRAEYIVRTVSPNSALEKRLCWRSQAELKFIRATMGVRAPY